ncbi:MAG: hypothetical protein GYB54_06485 [Gammaproteobacteria bacterium]|nr:hypothetical protein [Gammaproteobacteria bacterium]
MHTATDYLDSTESAVKQLFQGIDSYLSVLRQASGITFITGTPFGPAHDVEFSAWKIANANRLAKAREAESRFMAETFALDTLCGAVLQIAEKALEIYSINNHIPTQLTGTVRRAQAKFCVGRTVRNVPLGLIIYAARNQHTHFNDDALREPSATVFQHLATSHGYGGGGRIVDPAFDLSNPGLVSYASNVTALIEWRDYSQYISDMRDMLGA